MTEPKYLKFSVVMQVYLGDYPHSRSRPKEKFIRAINSFLAQSYPFKELIIVSDGCLIAKSIYEKIYTSNPLIKFVWLDTESSNRMYTKTDQQKTRFRGYPKAVGCQHATGDIICYLDADDIMLPDHLFTLNSFWMFADPQMKWGTNNLRIVHTNLLKLNLPHEKRKAIYTYKTIDLSPYGIYDDFFVNICAQQHEFSCATYNLSHRKNIDLTWKDTESVNEDVSFVQQLNQKYPKSLYISSPTMVVCHYKEGWDV